MGGTVRRQRFGRDRRLRGRRQFARVFEARCTASDGRLLVHAVKNDGGPTRLGVVVSRAYGSAVQRNRFKRLVREGFRLHQDEWPGGYDLVVRPGRRRERVSLQQVMASLRALVPAATSQTKRKMGKSEKAENH